MEKDRNNKPDVSFVFLLTRGFTLLPFSGFLDTVRHAADEDDRSGQKYCHWTVANPNRNPITSSCGTQIIPDKTLEEINLKTIDYIVVIGGLVEYLNHLESELDTFLQLADSNGVKLIGIDNGTFVLARAGLMTRRTVSIHWRHRSEFLNRFPDIKVANDMLYLFDDNRITCPGGTASIDLAIEILTYHCGAARAAKGLPDLIVDEQRTVHHRLKSFNSQIDKYIDHRVKKAEILMRQHLSSPKTKKWLGNQVGISERQLDRIFYKHYNKSTAAYWFDMRLQHSRWRLVNSSRTINSIAYECGFGDCSHFAGQFKKEFGLSPSAYRKSNVQL